jgi:Ser/Thr protein kinase RdoA (MazF antagonist)
MSNTFFDQDVKIQTESLTAFAHEILKKYGISDAEVKCINFEFNATFSVSTQSGQKYALRLNINSTRTVPNIKAETQWVRDLARIPTINIPTPIATLDDEYLVSAHHADSDQTIYGVMYSWLEGEELGDEPTLDQLHTVGRAMALLHENSSHFKLTDGAELPTFNDFFWGTEDFLFSSKSVIPPRERELLQQAHDLIMKYTDELYATSEVHIIHADLHGWNLMWHEDQVSIFDFDDCGYGVEAQDIAVALYYLDTPEQEVALLDGYKSIRPLPTYSENAMKALLLQRRLFLLSYLYETKNPEHKEMLPAYLEKTIERVSTFLTDVTQ